MGLMDYIGTANVLGSLGDSLGTFGSTINKPLIQQGFSTPTMRAADEAVQGIGGRLQPTGNQSFFSKMKDKWNAIPDEKKSAFAQQMGESAKKGLQQPQMTPISYTPQDYSWVFQPTRGSMFYGN